MSNTTNARHCGKAGALVLALCLAAAPCHAGIGSQESTNMNATRNASETLSLRHQSIIPIAAFAAAGDIARLNTELEQGSMPA